MFTKNQRPGKPHRARTNNQSPYKTAAMTFCRSLLTALLREALELMLPPLTQWLPDDWL